MLHFSVPDNRVFGAGSEVTERTKVWLLPSMNTQVPQPLALILVHAGAIRAAVGTSLFSCSTP